MKMDNIPMHQRKKKLLSRETLTGIYMTGYFAMLMPSDLAFYPQ
jgi:hypothetical protein